MSGYYSKLYGFGKIVTCLGARLFYGRSIVGREHWIPGPALITPNHESFLDAPLIGSACPEQITYLARKTLFGNFFFRKLCLGLGAIAIDRDAADFASIKRILGALRQGRKVLVFPEGYRTSDGNFQPPKAGIGFLVHQAHVPVIPVYIHGSYRAWPRHRRLPVPRKTVVVFGPPIHFDKYFQARGSRETYQAIADEVMAHIQALKPKVYAKL